MPLIKCPKCGVEFDTDDKKCSNCDFDINDIPRYLHTPQPFKWDLAIAVITLLAGLLSFCTGEGLIGALMLAVFIGVSLNHFKEVEDIRLSKTDPIECLIRQQEREQEKAKRAQANIDTQKELTADKYNNYRYKCPMCGSNKIMNLSRRKKAVSTTIWGLGSNTIGKSYQCDECKYMW